MMLKLWRFQPDHTGHASGHSIPAVGEEPFTVAECTKMAAINRGDSQLSQYAPGYPIKVQQPRFTVFPETISLFFRKSLPDVITYCVNSWANGRSEPGHDFCRRFLHVPDGGLQHTLR